MEFRLLGPLEAIEGKAPLSLGGRKSRALLARLLLDANRTVSVKRLVDDLWGEDVPESAPKMVQIYVSQLRKVLPAGVLRTQAPGYLVEVAPEALDLTASPSAREGRAALEAGDARPPPRAARGARLWRGPLWPSSRAVRAASRAPTSRSSAWAASRTASRRTSPAAATPTWPASSKRSPPTIRSGSGCTAS